MGCGHNFPPNRYYHSRGLLHHYYWFGVKRDDIRRRQFRKFDEPQKVAIHVEREKQVTWLPAYFFNLNHVFFSPGRFRRHFRRLRFFLLFFDKRIKKKKVSKELNRQNSQLQTLLQQAEPQSADQTSPTLNKSGEND